MFLKKHFLGKKWLVGNFFHLTQFSFPVICLSQLAFQKLFLFFVSVISVILTSFISLFLSILSFQHLSILIFFFSLFLSILYFQQISFLFFCFCQLCPFNIWRFFWTCHCVNLCPGTSLTKESNKQRIRSQIAIEF